MCVFFAFLAFRNGTVRFTTSNSHDTIIERLGLDDDVSLFTRSWIRGEVKPVGEGWGPVRVDETSTPGWWDEDRAAFEGRILAIADQVLPARKAYDKARASANKVYDETLAPARKVYDEALASANKVYDKTICTIDGYVPLN